MCWLHDIANFVELLYIRWNVLCPNYSSVFKLIVIKIKRNSNGKKVKCLCLRCLRLLCISPVYILRSFFWGRGKSHFYSISVPFDVQYFLNHSRKVDMAFRNSKPWTTEGCRSHCRDVFRDRVPGISLLCLCACWYMGRHCYWLYMELFLPFHTMRKVPWSQWLLAEK